MARTSLFDDGTSDFDEPSHVRLAAVRLGETLKALYVDAGMRKLWIPKSLCTKRCLDELPDEDGHSFTLVVAEWFAKKERLI